MPPIADVTQELFQKEQGSAFDQDSILFATFEGGAIFDYDFSDVRDIKDMLDVDSKAATLERVLTLPIRSASNYLSQGQSEDHVFDRIKHLMYDSANMGGMSTSMNLIVAQMTNAFTYRKAFFEKCFIPKMGGVGYDKVAFRPPGTCTVQRDPKNGAFEGFRQMPIRLDDTREIVIKPKRAFVYIHGVHKDPLEGVSDLKVTQWCFKTKQKIRFLWYQFLEGQALPKTLLKADDETEAIAAAKKVVGLRSGGVAGISKRIDHYILESSGRGADQFKAAMQWLDAEASSSVLAGFTDLGAAAQQGIGSFALSKNQTDFFLMSEQAKSREMEDFVNQFMVADLVFWNFGPGTVPPEFHFGPIAQDDADSAITLLQTLAGTQSGPALPQEFYDELIERVAGFLEMDVQRIRLGLDKAKAVGQQTVAATGGDPQAQQVGGVANVVKVAADAVARKQGLSASPV